MTSNSNVAQGVAGVTGLVIALKIQGIGRSPALIRPKAESPGKATSMEQIFSQLQGILVQALPTFFLVLLLHFYLKKVLFQPLERVLDERQRRTEDTVQDSEDAMRQVARKMGEYEAALSAARATIYKEMEEYRASLSRSQAQAVNEARDASSTKVAAAKAEISAEAEASRASLAAEAGRLADQITASVLAGGRN